MTNHRALPADGFAAGWGTWDGDDREQLELRWDNEAWTASGRVGRERIEYVMRLSPVWQIRQFLLFRDLEQPDLWLGTDGRGRWGEINGAHRPELDGARDIALGCTPFGHTAPVRRLPLAVGQAAELLVLEIDVGTLGVEPATVIYERLGTRRWRHVRGATSVTFDVDEYGLPLDVEGRFRRL